ncbi:MAG TPA: DHHA1 domain-containing protein, partial [Armatimonadota bacterium]|nr:DHHA1 domain-containing protein [Armatimonadota bacterium]
GIGHEHEHFFDTVAALVPGRAADVVAAAAEQEINLRLLDADRLERCELSVAHFPDAETFVRIDHHTSSAPDPGPALVDTHAAAAGELIFALLPLLGAPLTPAIATCLQTALMVDTGRFSYTNTTPTTHRIAAELVAAGADVPTIVDWIWGSVKYEASRLLGAALSTLRRGADGRVAWAVLRNEDFASVNATPEDTEGIIDAVRAVRGVEVAALFSEKRGTIRVSLRSRGHVDVAALARRFGGGGHVKAAGLTCDGTMEQAICAVIGAIEQALDAEG